MASTLRERRKEDSIKLNYGSLYTVIEQLLREKCIAVREVVKEGRRPEKTVYELTAAGEAELTDWMRELVGSPVKEYPCNSGRLFPCIPALPPEEVTTLLGIRLGLLVKGVTPDCAGGAHLPGDEVAATIFTGERVPQGAYADRIQNVCKALRRGPFTRRFEAWPEWMDGECERRLLKTKTASSRKAPRPRK